MTDPHTPDQTDPLIARLAAADPVEREALPAAADPAAQRLLDSIVDPALDLADDPGPDPAAAEQSVSRPPASVPLVASRAPESVAVGTRLAQKAPSYRRRLPFIGAAAAVLILVAGLLVLAPDNTPSAVATVHSAAAATADADSARITTTFSLDHTGSGEFEQVTGEFQASYSGTDLAFTVVLDERTAGLIPADLATAEARLVDDVLYVNDGQNWFGVDTDGLLGQMVVDFVDPRSILGTVQELTETEELGSAVAEGVETTHYRSVVDLGDESLSQSGWLAFEGIEIEAEGEVVVDLFVDGAGVLRQLDLVGDVRDPAGSGEQASFEVSTVFHDIGADITIEAPDAAELVTPFEGLLGD